MFNTDKIQRSISGRSAIGTSASLYSNPSTLAYSAKNEYVLYKVPKNLRRTSSIPSMSNFRLSHGDELVIMYQRNGSEPYFSIVVNGSTALLRRLDILLPFLSSTSPLEITALYDTLSNTIVAIACSVKNHPRVWSTPSAIKSAGYTSRLSRMFLFSNG